MDPFFQILALAAIILMFVGSAVYTARLKKPTESAAIDWVPKKIQRSPDTIAQPAKAKQPRVVGRQEKELLTYFARTNSRARRAKRKQHRQLVRLNQNCGVPRKLKILSHAAFFRLCFASP